MLGVIRKADYTITDTAGGTKDGYYFLRNAFSATKREVGLGGLGQRFSEALRPLKLQDLAIRTEDADRKKSAAILVSEQSYCLKELLHQWDEGGLNLDIACVIGNSREAERLVKYYGIGFHYVDAGNKRRDGAPF